MKIFKNLTGILLVDDDIPTNFIHGKVIQKTGLAVKVKSVTNVTDASDFLMRKGKFENGEDVFRPGIIFLDINMPGLTGWDFMDKYHRLDPVYKANIVVIMLTTSLNPADAERAKKDKEITSFLHKPLNPQILEELIAAHFEEDTGN